MKKYFFTALVAVGAISGAFGYFNKPTPPQLNALGIANLEALSYDEWGFDAGCKGPGDGCLLRDGDIIQWFEYLRGVDDPNE